MRGQIFHNCMVHDTKQILISLGWLVFLEFALTKDGVTTFVDILAMKHRLMMAFEIETSARHIIENCYKATAVDIPLCIIVPNTHIYKMACQKLNNLHLTPGGRPIKVFMLHQLQQGFANYLSLFIQADSQMEKKINKYETLQ